MAKLIPGQLRMFDLPTCETLSNVTSSPGSAAGPTLFDSLDGPMTAPSGPAPVPANPSRAPAPKLAGTIRATFGLSGASSYASASLQSSLVNRLKQRLDMDGSIVFAMTWKRKTTPSGRVVYRVQASARSTSGTGSGSWPKLNTSEKAAHWPTPNTPSGGRSVDPSKMSATGVTLDGKKHTVSLEHVARFASWPTPMVNDELGSDYCYGPKKPDGTRATFHKLPGAAKLANWRTPRTEDSESTGAHQGTPDTLTSRLASWATPKSADTKGDPYQPTETRRTELRKQVFGIDASGSPVATGKRGQLNPALSRWLQGYPVTWCQAAIRAQRMRTPRRKGASAG